MHKVSVLIKNKAMQYEGLRISLGLLLEDLSVTMLVLDHEIADFNEAYSDNLGFLKEMEGDFFSNNLANVEKYEFQHADFEIICSILKGADLVIPL